MMLGKKVAMFGHKHIPSREGGVEIVVEELCTRMASMGHDVICYNRGGHHVSGAQYDAQITEYLENVQLKTVWTLDKKGLAAVSSSICAAFCSAFSKVDVVHIHAEGPAFMCWLPKLFGKKIIVTVHGLDWQREKWKGGFGAKYIRLGERMAVRFADEIIVLSRNMQRYFMDTYGRKTVFIPNGVTKPVVREARKLTEFYGLHKDEYILFLGRLVPEKGVHYLIEAYQNIRTDKKLVIAGGTSDTDEYVQKLRGMAGDDPDILFTGFVQGQLLEELYSNAYLYVLPSDVEGMPLSLLEAMSYGNCCVVSDIPECTEIAGEHAAVFSKGNVKELAKCLQVLCDDHLAVFNQKTIIGEYICREYSWEDVVRKTLELYQ